jgi:hypothetical protein
VRFKADGFVSKLRMASAEDPVLSEIHVQLLLERVLHINIRNDSEPLLLETLRDLLKGFLKWNIEFARMESHNSGV